MRELEGLGKAGLWSEAFGLFHGWNFPRIMRPKAEHCNWRLSGDRKAHRWSTTCRCIEAPVLRLWDHIYGDVEAELRQGSSWPCSRQALGCERMSSSTGSGLLRQGLGAEDLARTGQNGRCWVTGSWWLHLRKHKGERRLNAGVEVIGDEGDERPKWTGSISG